MSTEAEHSPLEQFTVSPVIQMPRALGMDTSLTNSGIAMLVAVLLVALFFKVAMRKRAAIPGRFQSFAEIIYQFVYGILEENAGHKGKKFFPFIFSLFLFVLFVNMIGLVPLSFAPTAHISITLALGLLVFTVVTIVGIAKQGLVGFFGHFVPSGLPIWIVPLIFPIELISYLSRPLSLGVRLAANMTAGHTLMHVIAGFVAPLAVFGVLPLAFLAFMTGLELFVAILQAYVFTLLSCMYLSEALADNHH